MINSKTKISTFVKVKSGNSCLRVCQKALFDWIFFKIGLVSVRDPIKIVPILQAGWPALDPPSLPLLREVFILCQKTLDRQCIWNIF